MDNNKDNKGIYNENHMENCNVFQGNIYGATFPLPGANVTINQYYGKGQSQQPKEEVKEGKVESAEERENRKIMVIKDITSHFNFKENMLEYDNTDKLITNERLSVLFSKCLGVGGYPSTTNRLLMEELWVLLIDKRNQCFKQPKEDFFRQTVLNIIGYFVGKRLICGSKLDIAQCIFKDADTNLARNIDRNIESTVFPKGTKDMLDYYINELKDGKF